MKKGDLVRLKTDPEGPLMIVQKTFDDLLFEEMAFDYSHLIKKVECVWQDKMWVPHAVWYHENDLVIISEDK